MAEKTESLTSGDDLEGNVEERMLLDHAASTPNRKFLYRQNLAICEHVFMPMNDPSQGLYSPAQDAIEYETKAFIASHGYDLSIYQGMPNDAKDQIWQDLYDWGLTAAITESEHQSIPNWTEKVPMKGLEDQYLVGFDVFHLLHCLNELRKSLFPDRYGKSMYFPNGTLDRYQFTHYDHCIDQIRQSLMCHADVSTIFYRWDPWANMIKPRLDAMHTCRNFDRLREWIKERDVGQLSMHSRVVSGQVMDFEDPGLRIPASALQIDGAPVPPSVR